MTYNSIQFDITDGIARLTLNRPDRLNAVDLEMVTEMRDAVSGLSQSTEARVLLIAGAGRAFCSGAHLGSSEMEPGAIDAGAVLESHFNPLLQSLLDLPIPTVAAVQGAAAGAGCSLGIAVDVTIAARSAYFLQAFINIGLVPDVGSSWLLPKAIGRARATGMMMLGDRIPAERAEAWGMIWKCVDDGRLADEGEAIVRRFAAGPTVAYGLTRRAIRNGLEATLAATLREERMNQFRAGQSADFVEGVAAFREKRQAAFSGK